MFKTKVSVDRHVQELFKKVRDENERNLRCYNIAKLYYQVGDYESARRYVSSYLEVKAISAGAHKLLGQIYEALDQKENAFAEYKRSLELDGRQDDLVLKVCELLVDVDVGLDIDRIKYWVDRASEKIPNHPIVFELKEKMLAANKSTANDDDMEALITSELLARPCEVQLHVKLIKYYTKKDRLADAIKHAMDVEITHLHRDSLIWYETLCNLLPKCKDIRQTKMPFWILYVSSLERYASLSLREHGNAMSKPVQEATQAVFILDQVLVDAKQQNYHENAIISEQMFNHMWGQLNYHLACLFMRKIKREQKNWIETGRLCSALLLSAIHSPPIDLTLSWAINAKEPIKGLLELWHKEGSYRCSQAGHILKDYAKDYPKRLMDKIEECCNSTWREYVYRKLFIGKLQDQEISKSYFVKNSLPNPPMRLLSLTELKIYDETAKEMYPASLHHHVWLGIVNRPCYDKSINDSITDIYPNQYSHVFPNLQLSIYNLSQAAPDTIGRLDIDAFLNATILCTTALVDEQQRSGFLSPDRMPTLPADLTNTLCTSIQEKWWQSVYKIYSRDDNNCSDYGELRQEIQRGLEAVRCIGNHGLHINILVHLARLFYHRAEMLRATDKNHSDLIYLQLRYELYWSTAVPLLERLLNSHSIRMTTTKIFDYHGKDMTNIEMANALDEGRLILAKRYLRDKQHELAIDALQVIKTPEASYLQGEIYKKLADELVGLQSVESLTSAVKSQYVTMLTKARNCYYLTLDRLRSPGSNPNHPLNAELGSRIESIENELKWVDPNMWRNNDLNRQDYDALSEDSYSSAHSVEHSQPHHFVANNSSLGNLTASRVHHRTPKQSSTPRVHYQPPPPHHHHHHHHQHSQDTIEMSRTRIDHEARPSPERLDAQLRQLMYAKDNMLKILMDQLKLLVESNKYLVDSNKQLNGKMESLREELANLRIETLQKPRSWNSNRIEDPHYLGDDSYNEMNFATPTNNPSLSQPSHLSAPQVPNNLFAQAQRTPYTPLVYPPPPPPQLGTYYPGGLPYNDPHTQHIQSLYSQGVYPMAPIYPRVPPMDSIPKIPDMLQQGMIQQSLFHSNLMSHLTDIVNSSPQQQQQHQQQLPMQHSQNHLAQSLPVQMPAVNISQVDQRPKDPVTALPTVPSMTSIIKDAPVNKIPPVNVVITTSDTLPTSTPTVQPALSVTIPPQHRNVGTLQNNLAANNETTPHNYQISMPVQAMIPTTVYLPPLPSTLTNTIANTQEKNSSSNVINSSIVSAGSHNSSMEAAEVEYDPIPGFVPVIPLPAEVAVRTGEEDEETLFCARAKLFRFVDKEWKERGIGNVKLLRSKDGRVRLVMRREQVLKICANHLLTPDMNLQEMKNNDKAWIWVANDFADEQVKLEKLCIKFKHVEESQAFKKHFDIAKQMIPEADPKLGVSEKTQKDASKFSQADEIGIPKENKSSMVVGGFVFNNPPIIQQTAVNNDEQSKKSDKDPTITASTPKPSPFAGFSFIKNDSQSLAPPVTSSTSNLFSLVKTSTSSVITAPQSSPFATSTTKTAITPVDLSAQKSIVGQSHIQTSKSSSFTPILGIIRDDGKAILLESTVTLLRSTGEVKDWNERGVGPLSVLFDVKSNKLSLLIWNRERAKAYYNHSILKSIEFTKMESPNSIYWQSPELTKSCKCEYYAIIFKEISEAERFSQIVNNCQRIMIGDKIPTANINKAGKQITISEQSSLLSATPPPITTTTTAKLTFSDTFKPAPGTWECSSCYTRNNANTINCAACSVPSEQTKTATPAITNTQTKQFNNQKPLSELFKPAADSWECNGCCVRNKKADNYCVACDHPRDPSLPPKLKLTGGFGISNAETGSFTFGIPQGVSQSTITTTSSAASTFSFGTQSMSQTADSSIGYSFKTHSVDDKIANTDTQSKSINFGGFGQSIKSDDKEFVFGTQQKSEAPSSIITNSNSFAFGAPGKNFDFQFQSTQSVTSPSGGGAGDGASGAGDGGGDGEASEDEVAESEDIYFAPIIPLPDKVEVKTGEEDEEVLYTHRAKLFRFDSNIKEWKERGLGDIKLLRHRETKKLRLVMRRDQTLKLCLNHVVNLDLEMTAKDEKTWLWNAADFSDGEIEYVQLACRFKTSDISTEFKNSVDSAIAQAKFSNPKEINDTHKSKSVSKSTNIAPVQDLQVVYQLEVTPEEKNAALKLQLPENFYSYKRKDDCPGCLGCKEPDHPLFDGKNNVETQVKIPTNVQIHQPKLMNLSNNTKSPTTQSANTSSVLFGNGTNDQQSSMPIFGAQPALSTSVTTTDHNIPAEKSNFVFGASSQAKNNVTRNLLDSLSACSPSENTTKNVRDATSHLFGKTTFGGTGQSSILHDTLNKSVSSTAAASPQSQSAITTTASSAFPTTFINFATPNAAATYSFGGSSKAAPLSLSQHAESTSTNVTTSVSTITSVSAPTFNNSSQSTSSPFSGTIFDGVAASTKSLFGGSMIKSDTTIATTPTTASFSITSGSFETIAKSTEPTTLFGSMSSSTLSFGNLTNSSSIIDNKSLSTPSPLADNKVFGETPSIFGGKIFENATPTFGSIAQTVKTNENSSKTKVALTSPSFLNTENITTFSTLAAANTQTTGFKTDPNFSFAGAGQTIFGSKTPGNSTAGQKQTAKSPGENDGDQDGDGNNENEEYDPHYEPLIPLPDAIEVRTGEEDEEKLFCHRAKLYRFEIETKEWKERGVGEMKLLYHPLYSTYRLLFRREQVHKVVCNFLLTADVEFQPLTTSDRAWMWGGMNYTDETFQIEKLAVKFKSPELAAEFKSAIEKAQEELRVKQQDSQSLHKSEVEDEYKNYHVEEEEDDGGDEGEDDEDEQHSLMFEQPAVLSYLNDDNTWTTFGSGQLKMLYDSDIFGARIIFELIPGEVISSTVISIETEMLIDGYECMWTALDVAIEPPMRRTLKATFTMKDFAQKMYVNFQDGQEYARQADISEAAYYDDQHEP